MKQEPLKDKTFRNKKGQIPYHIDEDIKNAVEWLKGVIRATRDDMPTKLMKHCVTRDGGVIDQAFEDITSPKDK